MKLFLIVWIALVLILSLAACGDTERHAEPQHGEMPTHLDEVEKFVDLVTENNSITETQKVEIEKVDTATQEQDAETTLKPDLGVKSSSPVMKLETSFGEIVIELDADHAPISVANVLRYANEGFYNGTVFHRVIADFMIQGGGFAIDLENKSFEQKATYAEIKNEGNNGLKNLRGTVSMARTNDPDSATAQFYINLVDNGHLDYQIDQAGYCVFGKVIQGMDIVDEIGAVETGRSAWPVNPIIIKSVSVISKQENHAQDGKAVDNATEKVTK